MTQQRAPRRFDERWRLSRAGIVNVWHYLDNEFDLSGGRMILRGTNGSGKSRALELLLPFLLDADRRRMDATGLGRVSLDELMRTGAREQANRTGYLWLELARPGEYLTLGALVRHSRSASATKVWYFTTPLRVGDQLRLLSDTREPLPRDALTELIGAESVTDSPGQHRERVRTLVFGLDGGTGRDRYDGLVQLLHTLRAPDVGNRIDEGRLPQILQESLPPLHDEALARAGEQLDGLTETRAAQERLERSAEQVAGFLTVYRRYAADTLRATGQATLEAVAAVTDAQHTAAAKAAERDALEAEYGRLQAEERRLIDDLAELDATLKAIESREIFKTADDLVQRDRAVAALATAVDQAFAGAARERANHDRAVGDTDTALGELRHAVNECADTLAAAREAVRDCGLPDGSLPGEVRLIEHGRTAGSSVLRSDRHSDPNPVARPAPVLADVVPDDAAAARQGAETAATAANERLTLAERRLAEARRLETAEQQVRLVEAEAQHLAAAAADDSTAAEEAATTRDDTAVSLARGWQRWTSDPRVRELLGAIDWTAHHVLAPVLADLEALTGESTDSLAALDEVAETAARPARSAVETQRAQLALDEQAARKRERELRAERDELSTERDPQPADPPWLAADRAGQPLWRCVEFTDDMPDADRAGLEGALLAAGLLTATVEPDGTVRAADGQILLTAQRSTPGRPLSTALRPDPAAALPAETINAVLDSIGYDDPDSGTAVAADGSWRNGPLRGRHVTDRARHIGAAARAAHRRERIAAIDAELSAIGADEVRRQHRRSELDETVRSIDGLVAAAPRTADLHAARREAATAIARAARSAGRSAAEAERARAQRAAWAAEVRTHRDTCIHQGLPHEANPLTAAVGNTRRAGEYCARLARALHALGDHRRRHRERLARVDEVAEVRDAAEQQAEQQWARWYADASELAAQHEAVDLSLAQAKQELQRARKARDDTDTQHQAASRAVTGLGPQLGTAREQATAAAAQISARTEEMVAAARGFNRRLALPGLAAAATDGRPAPIPRPEQVSDVRSGAEALLMAVPAPRQRASLSSVSNAFREFDREVSGQLDVRYTIDDDVLLVEVAGAGEERTLTGASRTLSARAQAGRAALSEREREVFTRFVLGGVAEELRRRVNQAGQLITAMNTSLREIRTTNGIGVRLSWRLREEHAGMGRILELVATSDAVRSEAQNAELTELLRQRVEHFYQTDPSSGYATHLAAALDYRQWHEVTVTILGPEAGQQRRLSRRAKLSQGETRFVSYVTLFAAADGYLTSLGDSRRALRLILLDDAFAKVDDGTVAELMGLLVSLDLDFVMTGHALWGCFPQVPRLDIYEVRRSDGSSAVTTHVHWDGRTRHLRSTA